MSEFEGVVGTFASPAALERAVREARAARFGDLEVYLPIPEPASLLDGGMPIRAGAVAGALLGIAFGLALTIWTSRAYPLVTGGMPIVSMPPYLVIAFELAILGAALGGSLGFLRAARLPDLVPSSAYASRLGIDTFALLVRALPHPGDRARAAQLLRAAGALEVREVRRIDRLPLEETP